MAYDFLKKLFGDNEDGTPKAMTYEELIKAIEGDNSLSIVNLKDGGYVAKDKFDAKETELKGVKGQLDEANETIKSYQDMDIEGIQQSVKDWEAKYDTDTKKLKKQLDDQARSHAEEMFMSGYKFTSKAARNGILAEFRAKNFQIDNGTILGGKEFMQSLMENEDYKGAFVTEKPDDNGGQGGDDGKGGNGSGNNGGNGGNGNQNDISTSGNIYTGQNLPRFSAGTNGGSGQDENAPKFNFGFTHIKEPESK